MSSIYRILFLILVLSVLIGTHLYVALGFFHANKAFFPNARFWHFSIPLLLLAFVVILGFAGSLLSLPLAIKQGMKTLFAYWSGIFIYLFLFFLLADLIIGILYLFTHFFQFNANPFPPFIKLGAIVLAVLISGYGFIHASSVKTASYELSADSVSDNRDLKIVMFSDLHLGAVGSEKRLEKIVTAVNNESPDLICIAGDLFDSDFTSIRNPEQVAKILRSLSAKYGVFACLGNHDAGNTANQMLNFLKECNITVLAEESVTIENTVTLVGRSDPSPIGKGISRKRGKTEDLLKNLDSSLPCIVLDHNPASVDEYPETVDLVFSGHTHRGQIFPGSLITMQLFPEDYGYYRKNETSPHVIVSSGVGTWGMPMRVGTDCEIVSVTLK